jgi:dTDP-4-dehydrorhamnose 3,5-epimerase
VKFNETPLQGAFTIELEPHVDERGAFARIFCERELAEHGLPTSFPQHNLSRNDKAGTLRGMHYNLRELAEAKLVRVTSGAIFDVIVDLRPASPTRWQYFGVELSARRSNALFVPAGFAHGFISLSDASDVYYLMSEFYRPDAARGFRYDDPKFGISWPRRPEHIHPRDAAYPDFDSSEYDA